MDKLHTMSDKEITRMQIMNQVENKQLTQRMAAEQLGLSTRQVKRVWQAYQEKGAEGLVNKSRGKPSHNQLREEIKQQVLDILLDNVSQRGVKRN